jgi:hypothetical protein
LGLDGWKVIFEAIGPLTPLVFDSRAWLRSQLATRIDAL